MKIDKAIEILGTHQCDMPRDKVPDLISAIKLGIEALKKWKEYRASDKSWWGNLLPGEGVGCINCGHIGNDVHLHMGYVGGRGYVERWECNNVKECWSRWDKKNMEEKDGKDASSYKV